MLATGQNDFRNRRKNFQSRGNWRNSRGNSGRPPNSGEKGRNPRNFGGAGGFIVPAGTPSVGTGTPQNNMNRFTCRRCGGLGHFRRDCPSDPSLQAPPMTDTFVPRTRTTFTPSGVLAPPVSSTLAPTVVKASLPQAAGTAFADRQQKLLNFLSQEFQVDASNFMGMQWQARQLVQAPPAPPQSLCKLQQ